MPIEPGYENIQNDVIKWLPRYYRHPEHRDGQRKQYRVAGPGPDRFEIPTRPTTMTTTILVAIALITLVYIGLKAYRKMFRTMFYAVFIPLCVLSTLTKAVKFLRDATKARKHLESVPEKKC